MTDDLKISEQKVLDRSWDARVMALCLVEHLVILDDKGTLLYQVPMKMAYFTPTVACLKPTRNKPVECMLGWKDVGRYATKGKLVARSGVCVCELTVGDKFDNGSQLRMDNSFVNPHDSFSIDSIIVSRGHD